MNKKNNNKVSDIWPSEELFRATLSQIPGASMQSPYAKLLGHLSNLQKVGLSSVAVLALIAIGILYNQHSATVAGNAADVAFERDMGIIDAGMNGLGSDSVNAGVGLTD